jgi:hypothetical protein
LLQFLSEEERDALLQVMADQASTERKYENERTMACFVEKIRTACRNPITFVAALWGFFYFWAYYGIIYVSGRGWLDGGRRAGGCMMRQLHACAAGWVSSMHSYLMNGVHALEQNAFVVATWNCDRNGTL